MCHLVLVREHVLKVFYLDLWLSHGHLRRDVGCVVDEHEQSQQWGRQRQQPGCDLAAAGGGVVSELGGIWTKHFYPTTSDLVTEIVNPEAAEASLIPKPYTRRRPRIPTPGGSPSSYFCILYYNYYVLLLLQVLLVALPLLLSLFFMHLKRYYSTVVGLDWSYSVLLPLKVHPLIHPNVQKMFGFSSQETCPQIKYHHRNAIFWSPLACVHVLSVISKSQGQHVTYTWGSSTSVLGLELLECVYCSAKLNPIPVLWIGMKWRGLWVQRL